MTRDSEACTCVVSNVGKSHVVHACVHRLVDTYVSSVPYAANCVTFVVCVRAAVFVS